MKKISWPYFETADESSADMGSMEASGDPARDIDMFPNVYDMLVPEKSVIEDGAEPIYGYESGMFSPVMDEYGDVYLISEASNHDNLLNNLKNNSSVLDIEADHNSSEELSKLGFNVVSICQNNKRIAQSTDYELVRGDARFYNFSRKFDGFRCLRPLKNSSDYEILINNVYNQLRPKSFGVVRAYAHDKNIIKILEKNNFNINKILKFKKNNKIFSDIFIEKNDLDKIASVEIYSIKDNGVCPVTGDLVEEKYTLGSFFGHRFKFSSRKSLEAFNKSPFEYINPVAKFSCDIAKTFNEKIAGLQAYPSLRSESGLIFEYKEPQDVLYHMGAVSYPIDIMFIDKNMRIKKICNNINPGSLATFGCHNIKYVLEICGGLCNELKIKEGSFINIERGTSNIIESINKFSNLYNIGNKNIMANIDKSSYKFENYNIITFNNFPNFLIKTAAEKKTSEIQSSISNIKSLSEKINLFDLDNLFFNKSSKIRLYKARPAAADDKIIHKGFDNKSFCIEKNEFGNNIYFDVSPYVLINNNNLIKKISSYCLIYGPEKSFKGIGSISNNIKNAIYCASKNLNNKIVFVTRASGDIGLLKDIVCNRLSMDMPGLILKNCDIMQIPSNFDKQKIIRSASSKYRAKNISLYRENIKTAGIPIPDDIKEKAKKAAILLEKASKTCNNLLESFAKNLSEYEKIQAKPEVIKKSKGEYRVSSKRILKKTRSMLINIRDSIRILNSIKDVSTTYEVIDSLVNACSPVSDSAQEIFNLIDKIDTADFFPLLQQSTQSFEQSGEDLISSIGRARDYINNNILGVILISE